MIAPTPPWPHVRVSTSLPDDPNNDRVAYIGLIFATLLFSFTAVFIRLSEVGPSATGFWRFVITVPCMLAWIALASRRRQVRVLLANRREYLWMAFAALMLTLNIVTWQSSVLMTSIANAVLISNLHPIVVAFGAFLLFGERISRVFVIGLVFALLGTGLLVRESAGPFGVINEGDGMALLGSIFFAMWVLCLKNQRSSYSTPVTMAWNLGLACPMILVFAIVLDDSIVPVSAAGWALLGVYAITVNVIGLSIYTYVTGRLPASICAAALLIVPIFSTIYGWVFFAEAVSVAQGIAGLLIIVGLFTAQRGQSRAAQSAADVD